MPLSYRLATPADAEQCNAFQLRLTRNSRTREQWLWEFATFQAADPLLYALALDGDTIVGAQALIRVPMRGPNGTLLTAKGEDSLVAPRYWGKDVLKSLFSLLVEHAANSDIQLLWGFNSSRPVFEKIGFRYLEGSMSDLLIRPLSWVGLHQIATMDRRGDQRAKHRMTWRHRLASNRIAGMLGTTALSARSSFNRVLVEARRSGVETKRLVEVPSDMCNLLARFVARTQTFTVDRSAAFLRWRLIENKFASSALVGAFLGNALVGFASHTMQSRGMANITDFIVCPSCGDSALESTIAFRLLAAVTSNLARSGATLIRLPVLGQDPASGTMVAMARQLGYIRLPGAGSACIMPIGSYEMGERYLNSRRWHFTNINSEGRDG